MPDGPSDDESDDDERGELALDLNDTRVRTGAVDGATLVSAVDVVRMITRRSRDYAGQILRRITHRNEAIGAALATVASPSGGRPFAACDAATACAILMHCPGEAAHDGRARFADVIVRHLRGDAALVREIVERNAAARDLPAPLRRFLGCAPLRYDAIAQIADFALETVARIGDVADGLADVRAAQIDDSGRLSCAAADHAALIARLEALDERVRALERALECASVAMGQTT